MTQQRLLVVDDDPDFCQYVRTVAEQSGYVVETIQNPLGFQTLFKSFKPTLIVLDLIMPEMDGIEIIRWLASKDHPVHVAVVTGYDPRYALMADRLAMDRSKNLKICSIEKPVHVKALLDILQKANEEAH